MVESMHGEYDLLRGDGIEAKLLGEELSDEAIHVLVGAAFPGGVGVGEEEAGIKRTGDPLVFGELFAIVGGQRMDAGGIGLEQADHGIGDDIGSLGRNLGYEGVTGLAFVERDQGLSMVGSDDQIGLPITESFSAIDDGRAQLDRDLVGDRAPSVSATIAFAAQLLTAQDAMQHPASTLVCVDTLVDGFVADAGLSAGLELTRYLLGTPQLSQPRLGKRPGVGTNASAALTGPHAGL